MTGDLHNIDDLFKAGLEGQEEAPEEKVWNGIEADLDKNSVVSIRRKYIQMRRASAVLLILLLGVSIYALRNNFINSNDNGVPKHMLRSGTVNADSSNDKSSQEKVDDHGKKENTSSPLPAIDQEINDASVDQSKGKQSLADQSASVNSITGTATDKTTVNNNTVYNSGNTSDPGVKASTNSYKTSKQASGITRGQGGALAAGSLVGTNNQSNKNQKTNRKNNNAAVQETNADQGILLNAGIPSHDRQMASLETAPRQMPGNTASISPDNALLDAIRTNTANSIPVKKKKNNQLDLPRFSISPMATLNLMSNKIESDPTHSGSTGNEKDEIERTEKEKFSITYSLLFDVKVARRLTIETGIGYMKKTTAIEPKQIAAVKTDDGKIKYQFDCSAGRYYLNPKYGTWPRVGDSAYTIASANTLHYINIPLAVKYYFGNNKLNFFALAGADANFLLGQDLTTGLYGASYYGKKTPPNPIGLNNVFVSAMLGGGVNYSLNRWLGLTLSPMYRFALNPINKDMPFKAYPRNVSLSGGVRFSF